jgi:hypothetical protein
MVSMSFGIGWGCLLVSAIGVWLPPVEKCNTFSVLNSWLTLARNTAGVDISKKCVGEASLVKTRIAGGDRDQVSLQCLLRCVHALMSGADELRGERHWVCSLASQLGYLAVAGPIRFSDSLEHWWATDD